MCLDEDREAYVGASLDMMNNARLTRRFPAKNSDVRTALAEISEYLFQLGIGRDEVRSAEIVLAEAMNNIVEHAYAGSDGLIELTAFADPHGLEFELSDAGCPLPSETMPQGCVVRDATPMADVPEGGFGWFLIRQIVDELEYRRFEGSNHLRLRLPVRGKGDGFRS